LSLLKLVIEANAAIIAQKQEEDARSFHLAASGWKHLPDELYCIVVLLHVSCPKEQALSFHKRLVVGGDAREQRLVPTILALWSELDSIFGPYLGNPFEATFGVRFIPDHHVALGKLLEILLMVTIH